MTATTQAPLRLARPHVQSIRLRNGEAAVTISAADQRVIVLRKHAEALLDDIEEALDQMETA